MAASEGRHSLKRLETRWFPQCWRDCLRRSNPLRAFPVFSERRGDKPSSGRGNLGVRAIARELVAPALGHLARVAAVIPQTRSNAWPIGPTTAQWHAERFAPGTSQSLPGSPGTGHLRFKSRSRNGFLGQIFTARTVICPCRVSFTKLDRPQAWSFVRTGLGDLPGAREQIFEPAPVSIFPDDASIADLS